MSLRCDGDFSSHSERLWFLCANWLPGVAVLNSCVGIGICLAAIINLAMVVLTFLQPTSPAKPIIQIKKGEPPRQTLNNARGYFFPYGELKHLPALDDPDSQPISASEMARIINAAISAAGFMGKCWIDVRAAGAAPTLFGHV